MQTTLTRIFIALESVSLGLYENGDEMYRKARKFKGFFLQNQVVSKKKRSSPILRLIFRPKSEFQTFFPPKIRWSPKIKKKERSSPILRLIFRPRLELQTFEGGCFPMGGLFSIFHKKSTSKPPKRCNFAYFTNQWGGSSPGYATAWAVAVLVIYQRSS